MYPIQRSQLTSVCYGILPVEATVGTADGSQRGSHCQGCGQITDGNALELSYCCCICRGHCNCSMLVTCLRT